MTPATRQVNWEIREWMKKYPGIPETIVRVLYKKLILNDDDLPAFTSHMKDWERYYKANPTLEIG